MVSIYQYQNIMQSYDLLTAKMLHFPGGLHTSTSFSWLFFRLLSCFDYHSVHENWTQSCIFCSIVLRKNRSLIPDMVPVTSSACNNSGFSKNSFLLFKAGWIFSFTSASLHSGKYSEFSLNVSTRAGFVFVISVLIWFPRNPRFSCFQ